MSQFDTFTVSSTGGSGTITSGTPWTSTAASTSGVIYVSGSSGATISGASISGTPYYWASPGDELTPDAKWAMLHGIWDLIASGKTKRSKAAPGVTFTGTGITGTYKSTAAWTVSWDPLTHTIIGTKSFDST